MNSGTVFQSRHFGVGTELNILFLFFATKIDILNSKSVESQPPRPLHSLLKRCVRFQMKELRQKPFSWRRRHSYTLYSVEGKWHTHLNCKKDPILSSTSRKILPHSSRELFFVNHKNLWWSVFP